MSTNYYEMLYGPWKGQNLYEVVKSGEGKNYIAASLRGTKEDLSGMDEGSWVVPSGQMEGKIFKELSQSWQNYFRTGTQERYNHYCKALLLVESSKKSELKPSDVMDRDQILDLLRDAVGYDYAKTSLSALMGEFRMETESNLMRSVGTKKIPGQPHPLAIFLKEEVTKFIDWAVERKRGIYYNFER